MKTFATSLVIFGLLAGGVSATVLILDSTNNYSATIADGVTVSQPMYTNSSGRILFSGAIAALGTSNVADFSAGMFTRIGNGENPGGNKPTAFASDAVAFTLRDENTLQLYDAVITYFKGPGGSTGGTPPPVNNAAGLVIEVNPIPEPSSVLLMSIGFIGAAGRRRKR